MVPPLTGRPRPPLEKHEQAAIVRLLTSMGASVFVLGTTRKRTDWPGTMQTAGVPDLLTFLKHPGDGRLELVVIECKRRLHASTLSPAQKGFRDLCELAGVPHIVGGLDEVIAWLTARGYLTKGNRLNSYISEGGDTRDGIQAR